MYVKLSSITLSRILPKSNLRADLSSIKGPIFAPGVLAVSPLHNMSYQWEACTNTISLGIGLFKRNFKFKKIGSSPNVHKSILTSKTEPLKFASRTLYHLTT